MFGLNDYQICGVVCDELSKFGFRRSVDMIFIPNCREFLSSIRFLIASGSDIDPKSIILSMLGYNIAGAIIVYRLFSFGLDATNSCIIYLKCLLKSN